MLSIDEALDRIVETAGEQTIMKVTLDRAAGLVLAEPLVADIDSPPFDKALMDGFAVRSSDFGSGTARLRRVGEITAGQTPHQPVDAGQAIQIMTGAPIPPGADAVVMIEHCSLDGDTVSITEAEIAPGLNIMPRGREYHRGETVLEPGHVLGAAETGVSAALGNTRPAVYSRPTVAIVSTGDEIVPAHEMPGPGQIRNSNEWTLHTLAARAGAHVEQLGIAGDDEKQLRSKIADGLKADILILSGGVSAGKRDLVPRVLADLDVQEILHGVAFKPGKPMWYGRKGNSLVFGLPGNPVSVLACFEVFVRTALRARQKFPHPNPVLWSLPLAQDFSYPTRRPTYHPARIEPAAHGLLVRPLEWKGSPDLRALAFANSLVVFPPGEGRYAAADRVSVLPLL